VTASTCPRLEQILALLAGRGKVAVTELAERFDVSAVTVRRDLETLACQGRVIRTHGGAMLTAPAVAAFEFLDRRSARPAEKRAIARAAAAHVEPGMTLILDTGTTTLELARLLGAVPGLSVVTSSLAIASTLFAVPDLELILLGGTVNRSSPDLSGPLTVDNLRNFHADLAFLGADGADSTGFHTSSMAIAQVSRAMIDSADRAVLVTDSSKFARPAFVRIAGWKGLDGVVTDDGLAPAHRKWLRRKVAELTLVAVGQGDA